MEETRIQSPGKDPTVETFSEGAALVDHSHRTILRLSGKDPAGMLAAILTNEVPKEERLGVYAALLNPKGRVQTDLRVLKSEDDIIVDTEPEGAAAAREILGRYAPFSRVTLEDLSSDDEPWSIIGLYGTRAKDMLENPDLTEHETTEIKIAGIPALVAGVAKPVAGYDLICPSSSLNDIRSRLISTGATPAGSDEYETIRIASGIPRFGSDITLDNFPGESESFLERAVSFGKGCYPGQETVARMHYRGSPNKKLHRFELEPGSTETARAGDEILQKETAVGWITSVSPLPMNGKVYALGYLSRKADPAAPMRAEDAKVISATPA